MMPMPAEVVRRLPDAQDRVLFGSDFPNIPHPYLDAVAAVEKLGFGDDWTRAVLHHNAARLFSLPTDG
jgi:predicted TIM-barrel fold metal-dependent hydrolase